MIDLLKVQKEIFENKIQKGFDTTDAGKEIILLTEELGELAAAYRDKDEDVIASIAEKNQMRKHRSMV